MTLETTSQESGLAHQMPVIGGDLPGLGVLQQWADANDQATRLVAQWVFTDLVPLHHWPNPAGMSRKTWPNPRMRPEAEPHEEYRRRAEIATASAAGTVLRGIAIGLPPNVALEQMHSIHGTIGMKTKMKYALALSHGIKAWDVSLSAESVTCAGIHPITGKQVEITITMEDARTAKWTENAAYEKTPIDLLWARAMGRVLDRVAGHVLFGLASVEDIEPETARPATEPPAARTTAAAILARTATPPGSGLLRSAAEVAAEDERADAAERAAAPDPDLEARRTEAAEPAPPTPMMLESKQWDAINRRFFELEVTGDGQRGQRLAVISHILGRIVTRGSEMTADEGQLVLANLSFEVVAQALGRRSEPEAPAQPEGEYDPTTEPGWGQDGADAGGEE